MDKQHAVINYEAGTDKHKVKDLGSLNGVSTYMEICRERGKTSSKRTRDNKDKTEIVQERRGSHDGPEMARDKRIHLTNSRWENNVSREIETVKIEEERYKG